VGGATKLYGAALYRLRAEDFGELHHHDGISPAWPISYESWSRTTPRGAAVQVHGARGEDPTEPPSSAPYPHPAVSHEPRIQQLSDQLTAAGYHPFHAPAGSCSMRQTWPTAPVCAVPTATAFHARPCQGGRRGPGGAAGARASERHASEEREGVRLETNERARQ
jgi:choline dehydrogenase-like flavoprotein